MSFLGHTPSARFSSPLRPLAADKPAILAFHDERSDVRRPQIQLREKPARRLLRILIGAGEAHRHTRNERQIGQPREDRKTIASRLQIRFPSSPEAKERSVAIAGGEVAQSLVFPAREVALGNLLIRRMGMQLLEIDAYFSTPRKRIESSPLCVGETKPDGVDFGLAGQLWLPVAARAKVYLDRFPTEVVAEHHPEQSAPDDEAIVVMGVTKSRTLRAFVRREYFLKVLDLGFPPVKIGAPDVDLIHLQNGMARGRPCA
jgi:hypothetical protein